MDAGEVAIPVEAQFTAMEQRLIKLLGQGVTQLAAADACGVSAPFVSQCMAKESFKAAVTELVGKRNSQYADMDSLADNIQLAALQRLDKVIPLIHKTGDLLNVIDKMDKMKRRNSAPAETNSAVTVTLTLPTVILQQLTVKTDAQNRVIDIGGSTLLPASSQQVERMADALTRAEQNDRKLLSRQEMYGRRVPCTATGAGAKTQAARAAAQTPL